MLEAVAVEAGGQRLVEGLDLALARGELVGLSGPSGLGKSTLLRAVAGLVDFAAGRVRLNGRTPAELGWPAFRRRVVYMAQRPVLLDASVRENLARAFTYAVSGGVLPEGRVGELLSRLGLEGRERQAARTLSVGQQQRVALARTLSVAPDFILLDEPTSALDAESVEVAEALVREEAARGRLGGILVSHDRAQLERLCGRVVELGDYAVGAGGAGGAVGAVGAVGAGAT
jgi:ABC-type multidrug transport system ATPase subunit